MTYLLLSKVARKASSLLRLTNWLPDPTAQSSDRLLDAADKPRDVHAHEFAVTLPGHAVHHTESTFRGCAARTTCPAGTFSGPC